MRRIAADSLPPHQSTVLDEENLARLTEQSQAAVDSLLAPHSIPLEEERAAAAADQKWSLRKSFIFVTAISVLLWTAIIFGVREII